MPINDFVNIAQLIESLKDVQFTGGGGGSQAVNPLIGGGSNVLNNQDGGESSRFFQSIAPGQQFGQPAGQSLNDLLLRPTTDPKPPQVINAAPDTAVLAGQPQGIGLSFSPQGQGGLSPDIAALLGMLLGGNLQGNESGTGGFPGDGGDGGSNQLSGFAGTAIQTALNYLFPESRILNVLPGGLGNVVGKVVGSVFGGFGNKDRNIQTQELQVPENLAEYNIPNQAITGSSYGHAWERVATVMVSLQKTYTDIVERFANAGVVLPEELVNSLEMPHEIGIKRAGVWINNDGSSDEASFVGYQKYNQQSVALMSASLAVLEQLKLEQGSDDKSFTDVYNENPSIKALYLMSLNQ